MLPWLRPNFLRCSSASALHLIEFFEISLRLHSITENNPAALRWKMACPVRQLFAASINTQVADSLFIYAPNKVAPVFFAIAFATSGFWHIWEC